MSLIDEALNLTSDEVNKLTSEDLEKYVKVMGDKINKEVNVYINSKQYEKVNLQNSPFMRAIKKGGTIKTDILGTSRSEYVRQELMSEFARASDLLKLKTFTISAYKDYRKYLKDNFLKNSEIKRRLTYNQIDRIISAMNKMQESMGVSNADIYSIRRSNEVIEKSYPNLTNEEYVNKIERAAELMYRKYQDENNIPEFNY